MISRLFIRCRLLLVLLCGVIWGRSPICRTCYKKRMASVVAVEFSIEHELDRTVNFACGVVIDREGTVILESGAISDRATPEQLVDIRVYRPDARLRHSMQRQNTSGTTITLRGIFCESRRKTARACDRSRIFYRSPVTSFFVWRRKFGELVCAKRMRSFARTIWAAE